MIGSTVSENLGKTIDHADLIRLAKIKSQQFQVMPRMWETSKITLEANWSFLAK